MKKVISFALSLCMVMSLSMPTAWAIEFADMPEGEHWSRAALEAAVANGLLHGYDNGKLMPGSALTRAEMAAIVNRAFGATDVGWRTGCRVYYSCNADCRVRRDGYPGQHKLVRWRWSDPCQ